VAKNNQNIDEFVKRLNTAIESANGQKQMRAIGDFMIEKVRVRTRLGYGVDQHLAEKSKLKPLSKKYIEHRKVFNSLSSMTTPRKSNLTRTGSMLDSLKIKSMSKTAIRIGPTGSDMFGVSNSSKAFWQEKMGRIFLRLSFQEVKQIRIFWLRNFKMLLKGKNFV
jgi:hypothetical protein